MMPLAVMRIAIRHSKGDEWRRRTRKRGRDRGLKKVDIVGAMMAADMMTAPPRPTAFFQEEIFGGLGRLECLFMPLPPFPSG